MPAGGGPDLIFRLELHQTDRTTLPSLIAIWLFPSTLQIMRDEVLATDTILGHWHEGSQNGEAVLFFLDLPFRVVEPSHIRVHFLERHHLIFPFLVVLFPDIVDDDDEESHQNS